MKCNLDCSYCETGIDGGHDNTQKHPDLQACRHSIDFMFKYADIYMTTKPRGIRYVVLNVYGGEALHHPDIDKILASVKEFYKPYIDRWHLTVTVTTNAITSSQRLNALLDLIDEFTVSYHSENIPKQKQQFCENLLQIKAAGRRQKCIVMMHPDHFEECTNMIQWLKDNDIAYLAKQIDHPGRKTQFNYGPQQVTWFESVYKTKISLPEINDHAADLADIGRACCGGRQLCQNQQQKVGETFVSNKFPGWYCSVNKFFLHVKQTNGQIFVNKDCKMNFDGRVGPIGNLNNTEPILVQARNPGTIQCAKVRCYCGLCAPKAADLDTYKSIMRKYEIPDPNLLPEGHGPN